MKLSIATALFAVIGSVVGNPALAQTGDSVYESKMHAHGVRMIPVDGGKYKVWTQRIGDGKIKLLLLHGGPWDDATSYSGALARFIGRLETDDRKER